LIPHDGQSVKLTWVDTLDEAKDNESWGLGAISLYTASQGLAAGSRNNK
jgi:hypothetical protein